MPISLYNVTYHSVWSLSYSSRGRQCAFPFIECPISGSSPCAIPPEVFIAHCPIESTRPAGLVLILFFQKSSLHISHFRTPYNRVYYLSYSSRSIKYTSPCIEHPIRRSSPCLIPQEVCKAHFPVYSTQQVGLVSVLFL